MGVISQTNPRHRLRSRLLCWPVGVLQAGRVIDRPKERLRGAQRKRVCGSLALADTSGSTADSTIGLCETLYGRSLTREEQEDAEEIWRQITRSQ